MARACHVSAASNRVVASAFFIDIPPTIYHKVTSRYPQLPYLAANQSYIPTANQSRDVKRDRRMSNSRSVSVHLYPGEQMTSPRHMLRICGRQIAV